VLALNPYTKISQHPRAGRQSPNPVAGTVVGQTTAIVSFFACVAVALLLHLHLGFVFTGDEGSATIGVVVFITEESNNQVQSQRDYLPSLDISTNQAKQQNNTLHIGTHILSESNKDNTQNPAQTGSVFVALGLCLYRR
jgi:hypothetical protein